MSVWLRNSLIELIWEIREGGVESVNPEPRHWDPVAALSFCTCLPQRQVKNLVICTYVRAESLIVCMFGYIFVCGSVCECVHLPTSPHLD